MVVKERVPSYIGLKNDAAARVQARRAMWAYLLWHLPDAIQHLLTGTPHVFPSEMAAKGATYTANSHATQVKMAEAKAKEKIRRGEARRVVDELAMRGGALTPVLEYVQQIRYRRALLPEDRIVAPPLPLRVFRNTWESYKAHSVGPVTRTLAGGWAPFAHFYWFQAVVQGAGYPFTKNIEIHHYDESIGIAEDLFDATVPWWSLSPFFASLRLALPYLNDQFPGAHEWIEERVDGFKEWRAKRSGDVVYRLHQEDGGQELTREEFDQRIAEIAGFGGEPDHEPVKPGKRRHLSGRESRSMIDQLLPDGISFSSWRGDPMGAARSHAIIQVAKFVRGTADDHVLIPVPGTEIALARALLVLEQTLQHKHGEDQELDLSSLPEEVQQAMATLKDADFQKAAAEAEARFVQSIGIESRATKVHLIARVGHRVGIAIAGLATVAVGIAGPVMGIVNSPGLPPPVAGASQVSDPGSTDQQLAQQRADQARADQQQRDALARQATADRIADEQRAESERIAAEQVARAQADAQRAEVSAAFMSIDTESITKNTPRAESVAFAQQLLDALPAAIAQGDRAAAERLANNANYFGDRTGALDDADGTEVVRQVDNWINTGQAPQSFRVVPVHTPDGPSLEIQFGL